MERGLETFFNKTPKQIESAIAISREEGFSPETWNTLLHEKGYRCEVCGQEKDPLAKDKNQLEPHRIYPEKPPEKENGAVLCGKCHNTVHQVAQIDSKANRENRLTKAQKRKLWKTRGMVCEICGRKDIGGRTVAIHPFRPADWNGQLSEVRILCATCLGQEASKRNILETFAEYIKHSSEKN
jgi:uncharacterized CHY-type Zn-finger protein